MKRARHLFVYALLISLALHLLFLVFGGFGDESLRVVMPLPIEASLTAPPARQETPATAMAGQGAAPAPEPVRTLPVPPALLPVGAERAAGTVAEAVDEAVTPEGPPAPVVHAAAVIEPAPAPAMPEPDAGEPEPALVLRQLPESMTLRYVVRAGDEGFNLGEAIYSWSRRNGHYHLVSVAEASGLAALFVSGKLVQTSEGALTREGLRPGSYWLERNGRRKDEVRFDWAQRRLIQGDSEVDLPAGSQDLLSFPFHLALTFDEATPDTRLWVSNGRKLRDYVFRKVGHERLRLGKIELDTLHLQGLSLGEDRLDVWLAPARHWLPLRIRTLDSKGKVMLLSLEEAS